MIGGTYMPHHSLILRKAAAAAAPRGAPRRAMPAQGCFSARAKTYCFQGFQGTAGPVLRLSVIGGNAEPYSGSILQVCVSVFGARSVLCAVYVTKSLSCWRGRVCPSEGII